jgi:predicted flap endonuclease-1-like 5' DNA nuclease
VNGFTLLALIALAVGIIVAYRAGVLRGRREMRAEAPLRPAVVAPSAPAPDASVAAVAPVPAPVAATPDAELSHLRELAEERRALHRELAAARADTARYRQIVVDIENNAPPPLLDGPGAPDDLKLIVGVGPVLERMLYQLGITTYRQIANWTERDIDDVDSRLHEFPGRIRRDAWVTQARALYQSKYGAAVPPRDRG